MKSFNSSLADYFEQYIVYRGSLGYSEQQLRYGLVRFDRYLNQKNVGLADLNCQFFFDLKKNLKSNPHLFNHLLLDVRGFFAFLVRRQIVDSNPLADIAAYPKNAFIPFVFSCNQTDRLLVAVENRIRKDPRYFLVDYGRYIAIVFMARSGLRISEPLRLKLDNYDNVRNTIYIEKTKFSKDRLIPLPIAAVKQLDNYLAVRSRFVKSANPYLIAGKATAGLSGNFVRKAFHQAVADIGCTQQKRIVANTTFAGPTPHSLRHSFAVNTLLRIKQQGRSPQHALPVLSAYMGHCKYRYTAVYLKVLDAIKRQALVDFAISRQHEL